MHPLELIFSQTWVPSKYNSLNCDVEISIHSHIRWFVEKHEGFWINMRSLKQELFFGHFIEMFRCCADIKTKRLVIFLISDGYNSSRRVHEESMKLSEM